MCTMWQCSPHSLLQPSPQLCNICASSPLCSAAVQMQLTFTAVTAQHRPEGCIYGCIKIPPSTECRKLFACGGSASEIFS